MLLEDRYTLIEHSPYSITLIKHSNTTFLTITVYFDIAKCIND